MIHLTRNWTTYDRQLSDKMAYILVNFAKAGRPVGQGVHLTRYNPAKEQRTVLGDKIYVEDMNTMGMDFMAANAANPAARPQRSNPAATTPRSAPASSSY
jgi:hypothetical protein